MMADASVSKEYVPETYQTICNQPNPLNFLGDGAVACSSLPFLNVTPNATPDTSVGDSSLEEFVDDFTSSLHPADSSTLNQFDQPVERICEQLQVNGELKKERKRRKVPGGKPLRATRGRPRKALVAVYHSRLTGDKDAIKIRIKKSNLNPEVQLPPNKRKSGRRKKRLTSDTDVSEGETSKKRRLPYEPQVEEIENVPLEQSQWALSIPHEILHRIFQSLCIQEGCVPLLFRLSRVCRLWREVAIHPHLWKNIDLTYVPEKFRNDIRLHWLIENRLKHCQDINLGEWKVRDIQLALEALSENCLELRGISLSGWKSLTAENLKFLATECAKLERIDLSSINTFQNTSAINVQPLVGLTQAMAGRLTHLVLAHNKLAGFAQIISAIASNLPNLQLLDISNISTFSYNTAVLHVEQLQAGCPKLRVLRITNSQICLASTSLSNQVASPGFPNLEELSLAGIEANQITARWVDDDGIGRILKCSNKLRLLDVRGCIRLTDSGLVKVPAWDLEHLFLSGCYVTRMQNSALELILQKWSHSLLEVDLAWSTATSSLDAAVLALAEKGEESRLRTLNLCGSSVSLEPVKAVLRRCPSLTSINLQSCRALPRGIKRLYTGTSVNELRQSLEERPDKSESDVDGGERAD